MATLRGSASSYDVGNKPPLVNWTIVRRDTAAFKVFVTDDAKAPLLLEDWTIAMDIRRGGTNENIVLSLTPAHQPGDAIGEFTVSLTSTQSAILQTGDIFDIQLSTAQDDLVWTVAQGKITVIEDITY
jgi:hypothetical protein